MSDYNYNENYDSYDQYGEENPETNNKALKGYKVIVMVLALVLIGISTMYFLQVRRIRTDHQIEKDTLTNRLSNLMFDLNELRTENDTISMHLAMEREKADSIMNQLVRERNLSRDRIRAYESELGILRATMENFIRQLDSLNTLNTSLIRENTQIRGQINTERLRADRAEERVQEQDNILRRGSVLRARDIAIRPINNNDREVQRINNATRLRVDFVLSGNEIAIPGDRVIYIRIIAPDGYVMANAQNAQFTFEGDRLTFSAMREVDYQNEDLPVSIYYQGIAAGGTFKVLVYTDGYLIGESNVILR